MLRIKYIEEFKNNLPFVVILADKEGLTKAYNFFNNKEGAFLDDMSITEFSDIAPLTSDKLYLNKSACSDIAQLFKNLTSSDDPGHMYFDSEALDNNAEIIISYKEYDNLF